MTTQQQFTTAALRAAKLAPAVAVALVCYAVLYRESSHFWTLQIGDNGLLVAVALLIAETWAWVTGRKLIGGVATALMLAGLLHLHGAPVYEEYQVTKAARETKRELAEMQLLSVADVRQQITDYANRLALCDQQATARDGQRCGPEYRATLAKAKLAAENRISGGLVKTAQFSLAQQERETDLLRPVWWLAACLVMVMAGVSALRSMQIAPAPAKNGLEIPEVLRPGRRDGRGETLAQRLARHGQYWKNV